MCENYLFAVMRNIIVKLGFLALLAAPPFSVASHAFEADEFRSGMSVEDALVIARRYNANVKSYSPHPQLTWLKMRSNEPDDNYIEWQMLFCEKRLAELHKSYPFSWLAMANIIEQMNKNYGNGSVTVHNLEMETSDKDVTLLGVPRSSVSGVGIIVNWKNIQEAVWVRVELVNSKNLEGDAVERKEEIISEMYILENDSCFE